MTSLRKLMECYRPEPAEAADPEMAALLRAVSEDPAVGAQLQAIQAWDAAIQRAMQDVSVPAGLSDRLLAALELDAEQAAVSGGELVTPASVLDDTQLQGQGSQGHWLGGRWSRRRWLLRTVSVVLSTAALLAVVIFLVRDRDTLTAGQVDQQAREWLGKLDREAWQETQPPSERLPWNQQLQFPMVAWQEFPALEDAHAVAYLASVPPASSAAYLLVIRTRRGSSLPTFPPAFPDSTTGNICVGIWKSDGCLYVLMVPGGQNAYRRLLKPQSIAWLTEPLPVCL